MPTHRATPTLAAAFLAAALSAQPEPYRPDVKKASDEGRAAMAKFQVAPGLEVSLFAAEPMLANPVSFCVDARGRFFVAETFRHHRGVTDNRSHDRAWLIDELACRTVEDRVAMYRFHLGKKFETYCTEHERIRAIEDTDGDGIADRAVVFADGFKDPADGIAAGLIAEGNTVWYTCIPKLWKLDDDDGDGIADRREALHGGFGVHTALLGHDMHGLCFGPDGRLYFSIGDRGFNLTTKEGRELFYPDTGAVLRCNRDGTELEVFASGLRNPQELAFDNLGNLFTGENNSDGGDKARWVHVVEGGDSGWRIGWQSLPTRGPWNEEKLWYPHFAGQAAWIVPPIANLGNGPAGLVHYPGTGLPARYDDKFFLCDFRGASGISGVHTIGVTPKGSTFELSHQGKLIWGVLNTDIDFGPGGALYITDWTEGWNQTGKGRIYRIADPNAAKDPTVAETQTLLREGMAGRDRGALLALLAHRDRRVRQQAQFALAGDADAAVVDRLSAIANDPDGGLGRIHAIWALGQIARPETGPRVTAVAALRPLLDAEDAEVRAQAARVLGEAGAVDAAGRLVALLADRNSRVQYFAALSLGKLRHAEATGPVLEMLRANADRDVVLRHAGVMALTGIGDADTLLAAADSRSPAVRMGVLLALRRLGDAQVARFLDDPDPLLVVEAARAIHDAPIHPAAPSLAASLEKRHGASRPFLRRAINANFVLGGNTHAQRIADLAADATADGKMRIDALKALAAWGEPPMLDRVLNRWDPLPARPATPALTALTRIADKVLGAGGDQEVRIAAIAAVRDLPLLDAADALVTLVENVAEPVAVRTAALETLERWQHGELLGVARRVAAGSASPVRRRAVRILARLAPDEALPILDELVKFAPMKDRRLAIEVLGGMPEGQADAAFVGMLDRMAEGAMKPHLHLDVLEAAQKRKSQDVAAKLAAFEAARPKDDPLAVYTETMVGGDAAKGRRIFRRHAKATCTRCHSVDGKGGNAGPDLKGVGTRRVRSELLASLVTPSAVITEGFGSSVITTNDGKVRAGIVRKETETHLTVQPAEGEAFQIEKAKVLARSDPVSSMPTMGDVLTKRELRDVIEYLASLRE